MKVAVIGGGIAGLAAAHRILKESASANHSVELQLYEAASRFGGIVETLQEDDCLVELGPDSFTTLKHKALSLCEELGLEQRLISTNKLHRRAFIAGGGALNPIPDGFVLIAPNRLDTFFKSNLLSRTGKLRMAIEQFIPARVTTEDESVASFVKRRFGPEAVWRIAQPMLGGIYTADIDRLSLRATMPQYVDYEEKFGSVSAGLRQSPRAKDKSDEVSGARYSAFVSFDAGMQVLTDRLAELIGGERIHLNTSVSRVARDERGLWRLSFADKGDRLFDSIILAVPTGAAASLLDPVDKKLSQAFEKVEYASSVVACLVFAKTRIKHALDGFGFVVPEREKKTILAASFSSVKFPGRCADDKVMIRVFMGGALAPSTWQLPDDELLTRALADLRDYLGLAGMPERHWIKRWPRSMPQYNVGHLAAAELIENSLLGHSGLFYAGAGLRGVGLPDCIASGERAARQALASLSQSSIHR